MALGHHSRSLKRPADQSIEGSELKRSKHNDKSTGVTATPVSGPEDSLAGEHESSTLVNGTSSDRKKLVPQSQKTTVDRVRDSTQTQTATRDDSHTPERALTIRQSVDLKNRLRQLETMYRNLRSENDNLKTQNQKYEDFQREDKRKYDELDKQMQKYVEKAEKEKPIKDEMRKLKQTNKELVKERNDANKGRSEMYDALQSTRAQLDAAEQRAGEYLERLRAGVATNVDIFKEPLNGAAMPSTANSTTHSHKEESVQDTAAGGVQIPTPSSSRSLPADTISPPQSGQEHIDEGNHGTSTDVVAENTETANYSPFMEKLFKAARVEPSGTVSQPLSTPEDTERTCNGSSVDNVPETEPHVSHGEMTAKKRGKMPEYKFNRNVMLADEEPVEVGDNHGDEFETEASGEDEIEEEQQDCHTSSTAPPHIQINIGTLVVKGNYIVGTTEQQIASAVLEAQSSGIEILGQQPVNIETEDSIPGSNKESQHNQLDDTQAVELNDKIHANTGKSGDAYTGMDASFAPYNYHAHEDRYDIGPFLAGDEIDMINAPTAGETAMNNQDDVSDKGWVTASSTSDPDVHMTQIQQEHMDPRKLDMELDEIIKEGWAKTPPRGPRNRAQHSRRGPNRPGLRQIRTAQPTRPNSRNMAQGRTSPIQTRSHTNHRGAGGRGRQQRAQRPDPASTGRRPTTRNSNAGIRKPANNRHHGGRRDIRERSPSPLRVPRLDGRPQRNRAAIVDTYVPDEHGQLRLSRTDEVINPYDDDRARENARREAIKAQRSASGGGRQIRR